jgi:hypothetical protein
MMLDSKIQNLETTKQDKIQTEATKDISQTVAKQDKVVEVQMNVPNTVVETIQNKIIGAQQKVGSFMSEVARTMYLNYKPPVTSFKMNLNPANLGSISIVIKANKLDSSVNVSMNMNNNNTLDAFVENRAALQNALQKQLGDSSNVSINFGMQNGDNQNNSNQSNGDNKNKNQQANQSNMINNDLEEEPEIEQTKEHY